jgi:hypothetical protein
MRHRTRHVPRVCLPRHVGDCRREQGQPLVVEPVPQSPVERDCHCTGEELGVEEGQMILELVQIDVLEVRGEMSALIVQHQEQEERARRVRCHEALQFPDDVVLDRRSGA